MSTELTHQSFVAICGKISERNFRRPLDVFGLRLDSFSDDYLHTLHELWFRERCPSEPYSVPVTIAALDAMRALVDEYVRNSRDDYQEELRRLEREAEALRDRFAEKFNDPSAASFEMDLKKLADAAAREGYEVAKKVRGQGFSWSLRPPFERALRDSALPVERDSPLYEALFAFFRPHFDAGFNDSFPPPMMAELEQARRERDPSLN